jgi:hypothetical protein
MKMAKNAEKIDDAVEKIQEKLKSEIQKHLNEGKKKLTWLEHQINNEKNNKNLKIKLDNAREKSAG